MSSRKKFGTVSRSEYDDAILRNNVRADNRLTRELKDVERAQKVKFRDITFETKRIQSKIPSGDRHFRKSAEYQNVLLQMSRQETMSAQAKTSLLSLDELTNHDDFGENLKAAGLRDTKSESSLENMKSERNARYFSGRKQLQDEMNLNEADCFISEKNLAEKRKVWESLSTPKRQNNTRAVRERLETEFIKSRKSCSSSAGLHASHLPTMNFKNNSSGQNSTAKKSSVRLSYDK